MLHWLRKALKKSPDVAPFPPGYTDIHSHLLPGLDDGAPDAKTALALLDTLVDLGIRHFVCTPHVMEGVWPNTTTQIQHALETFRPIVEAKYGDTVTVNAAAEYMIDDGLMPLISNRDLLPVRDNIVLVEMSYIAPPMHLFVALAELQVAGFRPLLAHPERYFFYHNDADAFQNLKDAGCLFQLNLLSLSNYYGKDVRLCAEKLLNAGMYDATGTDVHHERHAKQLAKIVASKRFGEVVWNLEGDGKDPMRSQKSS